MNLYKVPKLRLKLPNKNENVLKVYKVEGELPNSFHDHFPFSVDKIAFKMAQSSSTSPFSIGDVMNEECKLLNMLNHLVFFDGPAERVISGL